MGLVNRNGKATPKAIIFSIWIAVLCCIAACAVVSCKKNESRSEITVQLSDPSNPEEIALIISDDVQDKLRKAEADMGNGTPQLILVNSSGSNYTYKGVVPFYSGGGSFEREITAIYNGKTVVYSYDDETVAVSRGNGTTPAQTSGGSQAQIRETPESDFTVTLTYDGSGVLIRRYNGSAAQVRIPAMIQGMPVKEIDRAAFTYEETVRLKITRVVIPEGVTDIPQGAFNQCTNLTSVTIPEGVLTISEAAFKGTALTGELILPQSLRRLGSEAFRGTNITAVTIPARVSNNFLGTGRYFADSKNLRTINFPANMTIIPQYMFENSGLTTLTIPEGITEIESYAFRGNSSLTTLVLPSTIKSIGNSAFYNCNLTTITIPDSVTSISFSSLSFAGNPNLNLANQAVLQQRGYRGGF